MGLRKNKTVKFLERNVTVWELDVAQVSVFFDFVKEQAKAADAYLRRLKGDPEAESPVAYEPHVLDILMGGKIPFLQVLQCIPELSEQDLMAPGVSASDLEPIWRAVEEVNPFLLRAGEGNLNKSEAASGRDRMDQRSLPGN